MPLKAPDRYSRVLLPIPFILFDNVEIMNKIEKQLEISCSELLIARIAYYRICPTPVPPYVERDQCLLCNEQSGEHSLRRERNVK